MAAKAESTAETDGRERNCKPACRAALHPVHLEASNAGLILSSYLKAHDSAGKAKKEVLRAAVSAASAARNVYSVAFRRWERALTSSSLGEIIEVANRAVIGLGIQSPLETGLALHHTYGVPFIPGSGLKGVAAHYCAQVWGLHKDGRLEWQRGGKAYNVLFGSTEDAGHIVFHDAWLLPESLPECLQMDVMTVHHPQYYQSETPEPPTDFDEPTPIAFLSIRGKFRVFVQCDVQSNAANKWARVAIRLLREAMEDWGFGGKTSAGYGRILPPSVRRAATSASSSASPATLLRAGDRGQGVSISEKTK